MLAKQFRLKNFNFKLFSKAKKVKSKTFLVYKLDSKDKKFCVLAKEKIFKKSVERNKIRRQIYEIIRHHLNKINSGYYLIMPLKKEKYNILKEELLRIINF
ncbi:MAG: hypothetical protein KatS3mg095_0071 [Candidatus Parcubacteria bacterium]|nr:MAG: hypothetical protein KatS3mg095_0071 [Candidatus Parcubacteria bacterium]